MQRDRQNGAVLRDLMDGGRSVYHVWQKEACTGL